MLKIQSLKQWNWVLWMEGGSPGEHNTIYRCQSTRWGKQNKGAGLFHKFFQCLKPSQKSWQNKQHAWSADKWKLLQSSSKRRGFEEHCALWIKHYPETLLVSIPLGSLFILPLLQKERKKSPWGAAAPDSVWEGGKWGHSSVGRQRCPFALPSSPHPNEPTDAEQAGQAELPNLDSPGSRPEPCLAETERKSEKKPRVSWIEVTFTYRDNSDVEQPNSWRCLISKAEFWWKHMSQRH